MGALAVSAAQTWLLRADYLMGAMDSLERRCQAILAAEPLNKAARLRLGGAPSPAAEPAAWSVPDNMTLEQIEKKILEEALRRNGGNRSLTAEQLGLSRRTIQRKIQDYGLPF